MILVGKLDPNTSRLVSLMLRLHPVTTAALVLCLNLGRTYTVHCRRKSKRASKWVGFFCQCLVLVRSDFDSISGSAVRVSRPTKTYLVAGLMGFWGEVVKWFGHNFAGTIKELIGYSLVNRHTRLKGRVVESAGIRSYRERSGPDRWHNRPWSGWGGGRQGTDPLPALG